MEGGCMLSKNNTIVNGLVLGGMWWLCVYWFGMFNTIVWSIVLSALIVLCMKVMEMNNKVY